MMKKTIIQILTLLLTFACAQSIAQQPGRMRGMNKRYVIMPAMTVNLNLLNIALNGPILQLEVKLSGRSYLVPCLRYSYAGVISTYQWTSFEDDSKYDSSSIAAGIGYKKFLPMKNRRHFIYYGGFTEFIHEKGLHDIGSASEYEQARLAVAVYGNLGYRWNFGRHFFLNLGILPGYSFDIKNEGVYNAGDNEGLQSGDYKENRFTGMIDCSFGWYILRGF